MKISVIIPVLNERECLPVTMATLRVQDGLHELIVVDGGSSDGTRAWLAQHASAHVVDAAAAKGTQLNAGAQAATGDVLLFLHGDCLLPPNASQRICAALNSKNVVGGCFRVRFAEKTPASLRLVAAGINLRTRLTRTATGDQAIFIRREVFAKFGGCPDWPLFEDVDLVRRMKTQGEFVVMGSPVTLSTRRYLKYGVLKTCLLVYVLRLGFWAGVSPFTLNRWFEDVRPHLDPQTQRASRRRNSAVY